MRFLFSVVLHCYIGNGKVYVINIIASKAVWIVVNSNEAKVPKQSTFYFFSRLVLQVLSHMSNLFVLSDKRKNERETRLHPSISPFV